MPRAHGGLGAVPAALQELEAAPGPEGRAGLREGRRRGREVQLLAHAHLRLLPLLNSKGMLPLLTNGRLSQTIQHGFPEALAAALLRAMYRSALPASEYTILLQDLSLVEKCCAFLRGEFEFVNIIGILTKVASLTSSSVFGPGDASKPLASLEGTLIS